MYSFLQSQGIGSRQHLSHHNHSRSAKTQQQPCLYNHSPSGHWVQVFRWEFPACQIPAHQDETQLPRAHRGSHRYLQVSIWVPSTSTSESNKVMKKWDDRAPGKKSGEEIQEEKQMKSREGEVEKRKKTIGGDFISRGQKYFLYHFKKIRFSCT